MLKRLCLRLADDEKTWSRSCRTQLLIADMLSSFRSKRKICLAATLSSSMSTITAFLLDYLYQYPIICSHKRLPMSCSNKSVLDSMHTQHAWCASDVPLRESFLQLASASRGCLVAEACHVHLPVAVFISIPKGTHLRSCHSPVIGMQATSKRC
jgi:hypothetical protein